MPAAENISTTDYYLTRGKSFLSIDDFSNANTDLLKAISISERNAIAYYYLAKLRYKTRNHAEALEVIDTAIMIDQNDPAFHALRAEIKIDHYHPVIGSQEYQDILSDINIAIAFKELNRWDISSTLPSLPTKSWILLEVNILILL